ncbi:hypothetical protein BDP27DRAFT_1425454 [Rhodocollybia butyracea]|uniref:Uncharacterized protein n=1 Tax=Rhodocollybia butyracea TaxID=206335 RepID=A0A9P5PKC4_9AGAR|nr:hypothetical protein BDP27DRAFT_1425454 [Rhodocollybia butyracea]
MRVTVASCIPVLLGLVSLTWASPIAVNTQAPPPSELRLRSMETASYTLHSRTEPKVHEVPEEHKVHGVPEEPKKKKEVIRTVEFIGGVPSFPLETEPIIIKHIKHLIQKALPEAHIDLTPQRKGQRPLQPLRSYSGSGLPSTVAFTFEYDAETYKGKKHKGILRGIDTTPAELRKKKMDDIEGEVVDPNGKVIYPLTK